MLSTNKLELHKVLVVDIESTCWSDDIPTGEVSEVIEFGFCLVDLNETDPLVSESQSILVKPRYSGVSKFCTDLTSLTQERLDKEGVTMNQACEDLIITHGSRKFVWASWGDYDKVQTTKHCNLVGSRYPFSDKHINISLLFAIAMGSTQEYTVKGALSKIGLDFIGKPHTGADDAYNIAKIFLWLLQNIHR
ncbi:MAG: exonuclease domain-containing protein [Moorea sp. SIO4A3]|nr:exonuclease domain-containing protein [Moorena sp. SIO4A3]